MSSIAPVSSIKINKSKRRYEYSFYFNTLIMYMLSSNTINYLYFYDIYNYITCVTIRDHCTTLKLEN